MTKQKTIKVLILCVSNKPIHAIRTEQAQIIALHKSGLQVDIITHKNTENANTLASEGINIVADYPTKKLDWNYIKQLRSIIKDGQYDVVHALETKGIVSSAFASIGLNNKLVSYRGAEGVHWHDPSAWLSTLNPRIDKIICISNGVRAQVAQQLLRKDKAITVYKGHRVEWYENTEASTELDKDYFWVACSARYAPVKGVDYIFEAAQYIPKELPIRFVVFGKETDSENALSQLKKCKNNEIIKVLGSRNDALSIVKASDIAIQPSLNEGLARSIIEAMCLKKAVVATRVGGIPELIENEKTGLLVNPKDAKALAEAVMRLYKDKELREKLAENAYRNIQTTFSAEQTVIKTKAVYEDLLK